MTELEVGLGGSAWSDETGECDCERDGEGGDGDLDGGGGDRDLDGGGGDRDLDRDGDGDLAGGEGLRMGSSILVTRAQGCST